MKQQLGDWNALLGDEFCQPYFKEIEKKIENAYATQTVYPNRENIFRALLLTPYSQVKVCILGQDPYHSVGQLTDNQGNLQPIAQGLAFSVPVGEKIPPSLRNIYAEIQSELGKTAPLHGNLEHWAKQGVLLLNTALTVQANMAGSHRCFGWSTFTNQIIATINQKQTPVVFLLWGKDAQDKKQLITNPNHLILQAPHPSPLSAYRGFFGCGHFAKTNEFLVANDLTPIDWFE